MEQQVRAILETYVRPLVQADGGDVELVKVEGNTVIVQLSGTCRGCPGRPYTLQQVIARTLREHVDETIDVSHDDAIPQRP